MSIKRQFLWSMAPLLVVSLVNIFSVRLFVTYLGKELWSLWNYVSTFIGMFGFADLGLGVAVGRYIGVALGKGDQQAVREYWGTGNLIALPLIGAMALAFVGIGISVGPKWFNVSPENQRLLQVCFAAGGLGLFCSYYSQLWQILLQVHLQFKYLAIVRMVTSLIQILPAIVLACYFHNPLLVLLWSGLIGLLQLFILIIHCQRHFHLGFDFSFARRSRAGEMASYTGKTFATILATAFFGNIDRAVLGKVAPATDYAPYGIAANAGQRIQGLSVAVMGPVFANTSRAVGAKSSTSAAEVYNHTFDFTFGWYVLLAVWATVWHPVLLRLWLGHDQNLDLDVAPVFSPIVIAFCLSSIANISGAQLGPLNRVGMGLIFNVLTGLLTAVGIWFGWRQGGVVGVAYGFLLSRVGLLAQDLYVIRLVRGGGWLAPKTWLHLLLQCLVGAAFAVTYRFGPNLIVQFALACLHGALVALWLGRMYLKRFLESRQVAPALIPPG